MFFHLKKKGGMRAIIPMKSVLLQLLTYIQYLITTLNRIL